MLWSLKSRPTMLSALEQDAQQYYMRLNRMPRQQCCVRLNRIHNNVEVRGVRAPHMVSMEILSFTRRNTQLKARHSTTANNVGPNTILAIVGRDCTASICYSVINKKSYLVEHINSCVMSKEHSYHFQHATLWGDHQRGRSALKKLNKRKSQTASYRNSTWCSLLFCRRWFFYLGL